MRVGYLCYFINIFLILFLKTNICNAASTIDVLKTQDSQRYEIQKKSAIWNNIFKTRDISLLLPILSDDVQMASAGGKWQTPAGTEKFLKSLFNRRPDITWVNHPKEININAIWKVAYETGEWTESWSESDGKAVITGKYFALWKQKDNTWILHAIIFTPLDCTGSSQYCKAKANEKSI